MFGKRDDLCGFECHMVVGSSFVSSGMSHKKIEDIFRFSADGDWIVVRFSWFVEAFFVAE